LTIETMLTEPTNDGAMGTHLYGIAVGLLWTIQEALKLPEDASSSNGVNEETQRAEPRF